MSGIPGDPEPRPAPTEEQVRILVYQTMEQMYLQSKAAQELLLEVHARLVGAQAGTAAVAQVVDENQNQAAMAREIEARKQIVAHLYDQAVRYVQLIIAGAYAAYFTVLSIVSARMPDRLLEASAFLMTISLTIFVMWEVFTVTWTALRVGAGSLETTTWSKHLKLAWGVALFLSIITALPAIALSVWAYMRGIGAAQ